MRRTTHRSKLFLLASFLILAGTGGIAHFTSTAVAAPLVLGEEAETEDIIYLRTGRVLHGKVLEERSDSIVFRLVNREIGLESTMTVSRRDILEIERDVPIEGTAGTADGDLDPAPMQPAAQQHAERQARGLAEGDPSDSSLPAILVIPMKGQMGTDIHPDIYRQIIDDIRAMSPDVIVWHMKCGVQEDLFASLLDQMFQTHREEEGLFELTDDYRELVRLLQDGLSEFRQVMWVEDSFGISSVVALAWEEMYMTPDARLGGLRTLYDRVRGFRDDDVRFKMLAYWMSMAEAFLIRGNRAPEISVGMIRPDRRLSATWHGREVTWHLNTEGEYLVVASDRRVASFDARHAENLRITEGTAETIDDLALLLGFREYRLLHGDPQIRIERYVTDWRRVFDNAERWWSDFLQNFEWGETARARQDLQRVIRAMRRYRAVEIRFTMRYGVNLRILQILDEQLQDQIRGGGGGGGIGGGRGGGGIGRDLN